MPDLVTALAERLSMTLARHATALAQINRTEWEAIAREALAFVAELSPRCERCTTPMVVETWHCRNCGPLP